MPTYFSSSRFTLTTAQIEDSLFYGDRSEPLGRVPVTPVVAPTASEKIPAETPEKRPQGDAAKNKSSLRHGFGQKK
jgi:hypothetical protein